MRKIVTVAVIGLALAGCTTTQRYAGTGALIGGGTGAVIGAAAGGGTGAAWGAAIGAGTGALIGAALAPGECWARDRYGNIAHDRYGNRIRVRC